ncbi:MAG: phosphodiesterase [Solobacterium sp.]|nr:phosphodiesterase [Solobacterium sp.]
MNYLVISDIHGDIEGARLIESAFQHHHIDAILCLGDILYHGPRNDLPEHYAPKEVIALFEPYRSRITAVRGNCDAEVDQMVLDFPLLSDSASFYLGPRKVFMTHGHIYSPDHLPPLKEGDVFLSGHTHIPVAKQNNGIFFLNPGSASIPKENHPRSYGLLNEDGFTIFRYDHTPYRSIHF